MATPLECFSINSADLNQWLADQQMMELGPYEIQVYMATYDEANDLLTASLLANTACDETAESLIAQAAVSDAVLRLTASPTPAPPTFSPTFSPTATPTFSPTAAPTPLPTFSPTTTPTFSPTAAPTPLCNDIEGCDDGSFCNFDEGNLGFCLLCEDYELLADCEVEQSGLSAEGAADCREQCFVQGATFEDPSDLVVGLGVGVGGGGIILCMGLFFFCMRDRQEEESKKDEGGSELVYQEPSPGSNAAPGQMEVHVDDSLPASTV